MSDYRLYGLSFDSLSYDNQAEVLNFIKARGQDDGTHTKDIVAVLAGSNFHRQICWKQLKLFRSCDTDGYKAAVESLSRAFNLAESRCLCSSRR